MYPPKETTETVKERPSLLVEVKTKTYYDLKTMARKFLKIWTGGKHFNAIEKCTNILCKVKKEKSEVKALMELIKGGGVAEITAIEKNVNMRRSVTLEHCFGGEETQETTRRWKTPRWMHLQ